MAPELGSELGYAERFVAVKRLFFGAPGFGLGALKRLTPVQLGLTLTGYEPRAGSPRFPF
jgi:hypothetical protein